MPKRALVIVNQHYQDPGLTELPGAAADAEQLKTVLADPEIGGFTVDVVAEGTAHACRRAIQKFFGGAAKDDILLLHLSCHGRKDRRNRLHFAAADTEIALLEATAVSAEFLADQMEQSPSRRTVALLDCCYSGAFTKGLRTRAGAEQVDVREPFSGRAQVVITSSTSLQFSYETESRSRGAEPSVFTSAVVAGLRDGSADLDQDGYVSTDDLYTYVHERVSAQQPRQTPTRTVNAAEGSLYLTRNPRGLATGTAISDELRTAILSPEVWPRLGAIHELERLLASARADVRATAREALLHLTRAEHKQVAQQATQLWQSRGLGEIPERPSRIDRPVAPGNRIVAIDFGTTNSSIAVYTDGEARIVPNRWGLPTTPSVVAIDGDGNRFFGSHALRLAEDTGVTVIDRIKLGLGGRLTVSHGKSSYSGEQIASWILSELRQDAEADLGEQVTGAVMTIPAGFDTRQRAGLVEAARLAGIRVLRMVHEPTAVAMAFALEDEREEKVLVFDLGGGTLDITLVEISDNVCEVLATGGDSHLGGTHWDRLIANRLAADFTAHHGVAPGQTAHHRLLEAAERAKRELSSTMSTHIRISHLGTTARGPLHLDTVLTRAQLDELAAELLARCRAAFNRVFEPDELGRAHRVEDVDRVVLVGGASRIPAVIDLVRELSGGREPDRDVIVEGVVVGAAVHAGVLTGEESNSFLLDVTSRSLSLAVKGGGVFRMISRHTTLPAKRTTTFTTGTGKQPVLAIAVLEGEHEEAARNLLLGTVRLPLPPARRGVPIVDVTFDVDPSGWLTVTVRDLGTGTKLTRTFDRYTTARERLALPDPAHLPVEDVSVTSDAVRDA